LPSPLQRSPPRFFDPAGTSHRADDLGGSGCPEGVDLTYEYWASQPSFMLPHFGALRDLPQQVRKLEVLSMLLEQPSGSQPTVPTAFGAFDLDRRMRVVG
jgi:hypothetical protein